jgi:hypothetical protein
VGEVRRSEGNPEEALLMDGGPRWLRALNAGFLASLVAAGAAALAYLLAGSGPAPLAAFLLVLCAGIFLAVRRTGIRNGLGFGLAVAAADWLGLLALGALILAATVHPACGSWQSFCATPGSALRQLLGLAWASLPILGVGALLAAAAGHGAAWSARARPS